MLPLGLKPPSDTFLCVLMKQGVSYIFEARSLRDEPLASKSDRCLSSFDIW